MKLKLILLLLVLGACNKGEHQPGDRGVASKTHDIFLVRHAEKQTGNDPSLTAAGHARAQTLAQIMSDKGLTHIHSTDYTRTRETAAPIALQTGLEVRIYDPSDLTAFAAALRSTPGVHLVVGHSNTTPQLARALGGDPGSAINEQSEYDRLYVIKLNKEGPTTSSIERFGVRYQKDD